MNMRAGFATAFPTVGAWLGWSGSRAYEAGRRDTKELASWSPNISTTHDEILSSRDAIVARARDLYRNNATIRAGVDRLAETVIGAQPWLEATPDWEALGKTAEWAYTWSSGVEARHRVYFGDHRRFIDVDRKMTGGEMLRTGYVHRIVDGETCFVRMMRSDRGNYRTCWKMIDPDRLSNPNGLPDEHVLPNGNMLIGGCEVDGVGVTVAYHIRKRHPSMNNAGADGFKWLRIPRWTPTGTIQFIHSFRMERADQRRGVSRLAAAMVKIKQSDRYARAELDAAILDALNTLFIESSMPTSDVRDMLAPADENFGGYLAGLIDFRKENKLFQDGLSVKHLYPQEKVIKPSPTRPSEAFAGFDAVQDRKIAGTIGLSYPHLSNNWADINYSSGRLMRNEMWRGIMEERHLYTSETGLQMYAAWLEEDVLLGNTKVPGGPVNFYRYSGALCAGEFMGPGPGYGDPKKEEEANELGLRMGTTSLARIGGEKGLNWRKEALQRAHEKAFFESIGLDDITDQEPMNKVGRPSDGSSTEEDPQGDGRDPGGKFAPKPMKKQGSKTNG